MIEPTCTEESCAADRHCTSCGNIKAPIGRSVPLGLYRCDYECVGYRKDPYPPHLWPGELARTREDTERRNE